ncbi:MAG: KH domain-containing protein [Lentisphaeria bacterium]|nr:KH domain-containing protein [Lentisphaeria bacterium]
MAANLAEQTEKAAKTLGMMFDYLGLDAEVRGGEKNEKISLKINSKEPGRIIGRNGQTLDCMQYLLNLMMFSEDKECPKIMLDIDGYAKNNGKGRSDRRKGGKEKSSMPASMLKQQALDAAKEVKRWGEPVTLPAMNARDRRVIHMTLKDDAEVTTQSEGEGAMKKVVISAKKAE